MKVVGRYGVGGWLGTAGLLGGWMVLCAGWQAGR